MTALDLVPSIIKENYLRYSFCFLWCILVGWQEYFLTWCDEAYLQILAPGRLM